MENNNNYQVNNTNTGDFYSNIYELFMYLNSNILLSICLITFMIGFRILTVDQYINMNYLLSMPLLFIFFLIILIILSYTYFNVIYNNTNGKIFEKESIPNNKLLFIRYFKSFTNNILFYSIISFILIYMTISLIMILTKKEKFAKNTKDSKK